MEGLGSNSFTPLGTISPALPALLLAGACNPVMDLVALITSPTHLRASIKGKGRADDERKVSLWRMSGTRVWEVGYEGIIAGLAWSPDGLYLTLLTYIESGDGAKWTIAHLSVHDGATIHSSGLNPEQGEESLRAVRDDKAFWDLEWSTSSIPWPVPEKGCSRMIIDLLPKVTPVEPPKPTNPMMFNLMQQANKNKPKTPLRHVALASFPKLLPTFAQTDPQILHLTPPGSSSTRQLLSGIYAVSDVPQDQNLILAGIAHRMSDYLDVILRGLENAQAAQKEGSKQTMIWREELETCGEQQGMIVKETHDDLFRFLMAGRSSPAVSEWLGNRLTGRVITKWESTLDQSCKDIHKVLVESVQPALERMILLIDEVKGLSHIPGWKIDFRLVEQALAISRGLTSLLERVRRLAKLQSQASAEWFRWLQYEISRTSTTDPSHDNLPSPNHDVKLVWAFMRSGFIDPPLQAFFPTGQSPVALPKEGYQRAPPKRHDLRTTLQSSLARLTGSTGPASPSARPELMSPLIRMDDSMDSSTMQEDEENMPPPRSRSSSASTDKTVELPSEPIEEVRQVELEPLNWAHELTTLCQRLFAGRKEKSASPPGLGVSNLHAEPDSLLVKRVVDGCAWIAYRNAPHHDSRHLWLLRVEPEGATTIGVFELEKDTRIVALDFFDDLELVVVLEKNENEYYLATTLYQDTADSLTDISSNLTPRWAMAHLAGLLGTKITPQSLAISRSRSLSIPPTSLPPHLALNGRPGRRVACVSVRGGVDVLVFDMEEDEDAEGDDNEEEDQEMED